MNNHDLSNKKLLVLDKNILGIEFADYLQTLGMTVDIISMHHLPTYQYKSFSHKFLNVINRFLFNDKKYIEKLQFRFENKFYRSLINAFKNKNKDCNYNYILITRPDNYSSKTIKVLTKLSHNICGYMWDGISIQKAEKLFKTRTLFNKLYSFDQNDINLYPKLKVSFITNFYYPSEERKKNIKLNPLKISYIGSCTNERRDLYLKEIAEKFLDPKYDVNLIFFNPPQIKEVLSSTKYIKYISKKISYKKYLDDFASSFASFDLKVNYHDGLSFRVFESLYYKKKLISTNAHIKKFDFYHPDNILILENDEDLLKINDFLNKPYCDIPKIIINKYCADNWIKNIFDIGNFEEIEYPN